MPTCPKCRHSWTTAKRPKPATDSTDPRTVDTSRMSETEMRAFYKSTADAEDIRFWIEHARLSPGLRIWFEGLSLARPNLAPAEFKRQLRGLQDRWRQEGYWERIGRHADRLERRRAFARNRMNRRSLEVAA